MKNFILLIFISVSINSFSQDFLQKKDGSKIAVAEGSIHNEPRNKRVGYSLNDDKKSYHLKYKDLVQASYGGMILKSVKIKNKTKAFFVIAETKEKTLVSSKQTRIKYRGGFESTYVFYEVFVLDKSNNIIEEYSLTDQKTDKSSDTRSKIIPMIKQYFSDCLSLVEKIKPLENSSADISNSSILVLLNDPVYIKCI